MENKENQIKIINGFRPLLQEHYGGEADCTLVSITSIIFNMLINIKSSKEIYNEVEKIARHFFYKSSFGTLPIFIKIIFNKSLKKFSFNKTTKVKYIKNMGFTFDLIKNNIDSNIPMILSMANDGKNYYKNHSIIIIGYCIQNNEKLLIIYDNWSKEQHFLDYNLISSLSCLNY